MHLFLSLTLIRFTPISRKGLTSDKCFKIKNIPIEFFYSANMGTIFPLWNTFHGHSLSKSINIITKIISNYLISCYKVYTYIIYIHIKMKGLGHTLPLKSYYGKILLNSHLKYAAIQKCLYYRIQNNNHKYIHLKF